MGAITSKKLAEKLRREYAKTPPDGMTATEILRMKENDLLDMDYFLHENIFDEDDGSDVFIDFSTAHHLF